MPEAIDPSHSSYCDNGVGLFDDFMRPVTGWLCPNERRVLFVDVLSLIGEHHL